MKAIFTSVCCTLESHVAKETKSLEKQGARVRMKHKPSLIHYHFAVFKFDCYQGAGGNLDVADHPLLGDASGF